MRFKDYTDQELITMLSSGPLDMDASEAQRVTDMLRDPAPDRVAKFAILVAIGLNPHDAAHFARELDRMPPKAAAELNVLARRIGDLEATIPPPPVDGFDLTRLGSLLRIKECLNRFFTRFDSPLLIQDLDVIDAVVEAEVQADKA